MLFGFARTKISIRTGDDCAIATGPKVEPYPERVDGEEPDAEASRTASHVIVLLNFQLLLFQVDGFPAETLPQQHHCCVLNLGRRLENYARMSWRARALLTGKPPAHRDTTDSHCLWDIDVTAYLFTNMRLERSL